jgi:hypothetical protein
MSPKAICTPKDLKASKVRAKSVTVSFFCHPIRTCERDGVRITFFQGDLDFSA